MRLSEVSDITEWERDDRFREISLENNALKICNIVSLVRFKNKASAKMGGVQGEIR